MVDRPDHPLSVKIAAGGTLGERAWTDAVSDLDQSLRSVRAVEPAPFHLAVTFFVPGRATAPRFQGLRVGFYLSQQRTLVIEIVLPKSPPAGDARAELLRLLLPAVKRAEAWGRRKRLLDGDLTAVRSALAEVSPQSPE